MDDEVSKTPDTRGQKLVEHLLNAAVQGIGPFKGAQDSAEEAMAGGRSQDQAVAQLIRSHVALAGAQGFVTNLGGLLTLPVAMPANIGAAFLIQTHLAASIAHVRGHDLDSEQVRSAIVLCLAGNAGTEVLKKIGITVGEKFSLSLIKKLPIEVIRRINKQVGFMLIAKYGTKRAPLVLAKAVPLVGGVVGGTVDAALTYSVGRFANRFFITAEDERGPVEQDLVHVA